MRLFISSPPPTSRNSRIADSRSLSDARESRRALSEAFVSSPRQPDLRIYCCRQTDAFAINLRGSPGRWKQIERLQIISTLPASLRNVATSQTRRFRREPSARSWCCTRASSRKRFRNREAAPDLVLREPQGSPSRTRLVVLPGS